MKEIAKELYACLDYCEQQNGRPDCKNCGLTKEMIDTALTTIDREAREEERERIFGSVENKDLRKLLEAALNTPSH